MSTMNQPEVMVTVTPAAATEVKKFMTQEGVDPAKGGLRVSVQPGGCSGFKYGLLIEDEAAEDDFVVVAGRVERVRRPLLGAVYERRDHRLCLVDAGIRIHVQEPERHRRLRLRQFVLRLTDAMTCGGHWHTQGRGPRRGPDRAASRAFVISGLAPAARAHPHRRRRRPRRHRQAGRAAHRRR